MLKFVSLEFKNINSFGNTLQKVTFDETLVNIVGANGKGKSTIIEALSFNLYGVPYRKVKIAEIVNRVNEKDLYTKTVFYSRNNLYELERGLKPNLLRLKMNGQEVDLLSSKLLNQKEIDKILGVDFNMFRQLICLAVNYNKPFLALAKHEQRHIIENIFNLDAFAEMLKDVKNELANNNSQYNIKTTELKYLKEQIISLEKQKEQFKIMQEQLNEEKEKLNNDYKEKINEEILKIETKNNELEQLKLSSERHTVLNDKLKSYNNALLENKTKIKYLNNELNNKKHTALNFNKLSICDCCKQAVSSIHKEKHLEIFKNQIKEIDTEIKQLKSDIVEIDTTIKELNNELKTVNIEVQKLNKISLEIENHNKQVEFYEKAILENNKPKTLPFDITEVENTFNTKKQNFLNVFNDVERLKNDIEVDKNISEILSDTGVRVYIFKQTVPLLNSSIAKFLDKFGLNIRLSFDEFIQETITSKGKEVSYMSFSEGEKKRIDLAIQFAFYEVAKLISNWKCNLLFIDEMLDSGIDVEGLSISMNMLSQFQKENKQGIYIITHKNTDDFTFPKTITVEKTSHFSTIV